MTQDPILLLRSALSNYSTGLPNPAPWRSTMLINHTASHTQHKMPNIYLCVLQPTELIHLQTQGEQL
uniref:Uncharacterized protein n=1 Tax=Anguilla anguilla TaxID=7936 RepID=A0A0E9TWF8_ANGAN